MSISANTKRTLSRLATRRLAGRSKAWSRAGRQRRDAFTLPELLVSIAIVTILVSMLIMALARANEHARETRAKAQIRQIHELLMVRWESYRTRAVPLRISSTDVRAAGMTRLNALRDLMRMEMPDRVTDVMSFPATPGMAGPSLWRSYRRRAIAAGTGWVSPGSDGVWGNSGDDDGDGVAENSSEMGWVGSDDVPANTTYQGAECLYMILASIQDGTGNGLDAFKDSEIGDIDGDGMREILDPWKQPIEFIRWPAGLRSPIQSGDASNAPDPFDILKVDPRWSDTLTGNEPFALQPYVFSAGADKVYAVVTDRPDSEPPPLQYSTTVFPTMSGPISLPNDPYHIPLDSSDNPLPQMGVPLGSGYGDNFSNHFGTGE